MAYIDLPRDSEGWTILTPSADSAIVYVSEAGNDSTGLVYAHDSFPDILDPTVEMKSFATYAGANAAISTGSPDWILFKRGDSFVEDIPLGALKFGRSETEPSVLRDYGTSGDLPILKVGKEIGIDLRYGAQSNVIANIDVYAHTCNPNDPDFVSYTGRSSFIGVVSENKTIDGLLLEGCKFSFGLGGSFNKYLGDACGNINIRRCLFYKSCSDEGHAQGFGLTLVDNLIVEENIFYHNGWLIQNRTGDMGDQSDCQATFFNHNMYLTDLSNATIENNLILEGAGSGIKMTSRAVAGTDNVVINNNLILGGTVGVNIGNNFKDISGRFKNIVITDNVFTNIGWSRPTLEETAWYTYLDGWEGGELTDNLFIHQVNAANDNTRGIYFEANFNNVNISGNTEYGLMNCVGLDLLLVSGGRPTNVSNVTVSDNIIQVPESSTYISRLQYEVDGILELSGNKYYDERGTVNNFNYLGVDVDWDEWVIATGDTSTIEQVNFFDETRDVASYNASLGGTATIQAFIDECVLQDRYNWNTDYEASAVNDYLRAGFTEVFMTTTYHAPNTWNNSNNKYKYPEGTPLTAADALQNLAGDGSVMFDGSGNALGKTQAEIFVTDGVLGNNKQLNGCPAFGITQHENKLTSAQQAEVELDNYSTCNPDLELLFDEESGETLYDEVTGHLIYDEEA